MRTTIDHLESLAFSTGQEMTRTATGWRVRVAGVTYTAVIA